MSIKLKDRFLGMLLLGLPQWPSTLNASHTNCTYSMPKHCKQPFSIYYLTTFPYISPTLLFCRPQNEQRNSRDEEAKSKELNQQPNVNQSNGKEQSSFIYLLFKDKVYLFSNFKNVLTKAKACLHLIYRESYEQTNSGFHPFTQ